MMKITEYATVIKRDYRVTIIFVWLALLTFFIIRDTIEIERVQSFPPLEVLEVE